MRNILPFILAASLSAILPVSCNQAGTRPKVETRTLGDSTKYVTFKMDIDLPAPGKGAASVMREEAISILDEQLGHITTYESERMFPPFDGDRNDTDALLGYYSSLAFGLAAKEAQEDASGWVEDFPTWEYDYSFKKIGEGERYIVFYSSNYIYMGGAHGGITGAGGITFDRRTGKRVAPVIDASSTKDIQPLLIKGLLQYYKENDVEMSGDELLEGLFIEDGIIPLPAWDPYPTEDGLVFTYQQYEIASYAEGMPSFVMDFKDAAPFLTPEARAVLGL